MKVLGNDGARRNPTNGDAVYTTTLTERRKANACSSDSTNIPITAAIIASAAVLAGSLAASAQPLSARPAPAVPTLDWTDCGDGFQCANARVPLDYDRPHGRIIEVALIRRPAFDQANRIGSLGRFTGHSEPTLGVLFLRYLFPTGSHE